MRRLSEKHIPIVVVAVAFLLSIALTWPVVLSPRSTLVGHPGNDTWNHVWGYWWVSEELLSGRWPTQATGLAFPRGGTLYFIDTVQVLMSMPLSLLFGPAFAFNFIMLAEIALSGVGAWLLASKVTSDVWASFVALFLFEMSAHLMGQSYNGISETVCAGWFPMTLWALLRLMERPNWSRAVQLGTLGAMCVLTSWYYGLFAILGSLLILGWSFWKRSWLYTWRDVFRWIVVSAGVAGMLVIGPVLSFRSSLSAENAIVTRDPEFVERSLLNHNITDFQAFFQLSKTPIPDLKTLYGEELMIIIYLGWIGIVLAGIGIWNERRKEDWRLWVWFAFFFFVFCLGPYLHIGGEYWLFDGKRVPLPFLVLYKAFPIFDRISHPFRFVVGVNLAIAILASQGLRVLFRKRSLTIKVSILAILPALIWVELSQLSPVTLPIPHAKADISQAYYDMRTDPVAGAVLDLPLSLPNLERAVYVWNQSVHERAIPWGLNDPMPTPLRQNMLTQLLLRIEATHAHTLPAVLPQLDLVISSRVLARQGYRYIVVHESFYPSYKLNQTHQLLRGLFGQGKEYDGVVVYTLPTIKPIGTIETSQSEAQVDTSKQDNSNGNPSIDTGDAP